MVAARNGIRLPREVCVQAAGINGIGRFVCPAMVGRDMKIGMREMLNKKIFHIKTRRGRNITARDGAKRNPWKNGHSLT